MVNATDRTSLAGEQLITLREAAKLLPSSRTGRPVHGCTLWRWCTIGSAGVVLESVHVGGTRQTSREAVARFVAAVSAKRGSQKPGGPVQRKDRASRLRREDAYLRAHGQ